MKETVNFNMKFTAIEQINPLLTRCSCNICSPDLLGNGYQFSKEVLTNMIPTVMGSPIVTYYSEADDQFMGHEDDYVMLQSKGYTQTPEPYSVGFVDYMTKPQFKTIEDKLWLCCDVLLWSGRYPYLENIGERDDVYQSMEVGVDYDEENGIKVVKDAICVGLCLIGIEPAFIGSGFMTKSITQFSSDIFKTEVEEMKKEYEQFINKYANLDFTISKKIKDSAQKGLDLYKEFNRGGTAVALSTARYLIKNDTITPKKVQQLSKYFIKHKDTNLKDENPPENDFISWNLYGGADGFKFSQQLMSSMDKIDKKYLNTFMSQSTEQLSVNNENKINKEENSKVNGKLSVDDKLGKSPAIKIDNTKDSAVNSTSWSGHDASFLNKLLEASNHEALVKEAYARVSGDATKDLSINDVGYGHHDIKDNILVLDIAGVESAYKRARQQGETGEIMTHIERHRKELGLEENKKMTKKEKKEMLSKELSEKKCMKDDKEMCKYAFVSYDDASVFAMDKECGKMSAIPYSCEEDGKVKFDYDNAKMAKLVCHSNDEPDEDDDDEVYMSLKSIFSTDENVDAEASTKRSEQEAEANKKLAEMSAEVESMKANMTKLSEENASFKELNEKLSKENEELKASVDKHNKAVKMSKVESVLAEVIDDLSKEKVEEFRAEAEKFSLDNLSGWENDVKAFAYSIVKKDAKPEENITRMGLSSLYDNIQKGKEKKGLWD